jgi:glucosyl-dolichyl phosphate glucuronosyltransferase
VEALGDLAARPLNGSHPGPAAQQPGDSKSAPGAASAAQCVITAIICTYNRYDVLLEAIRSLQTQTLDASRYEILVIDNTSDHEARTAFWQDYEPAGNLRIILEDIPGLSRARNIGMREASAPLLAYIDDDAVAVPEWLESLVETFATVSDACIVGGPVDPIWPGSAPPWLHEWLRGFLTIVDLGPQQRPLDSHEWLAGTNIAFRKSALEAVGGFSETLGRVKGTLLSNEELVVSERIHSLGFSSYYAPAARVFHRVHSDRVSQPWMRKRVSWQVVSDLMAGRASGRDRSRLWRDVGEYLMQVPPEMRGIRGLFLDTPDLELFNKQCVAIGALLSLLLDHGTDPDPAT